MAKRIRELGTLKALGWPQRFVVRQVTGESQAQGALGGILGAAIGVAGAALITAIGPTLKATVAQAAQRGRGPFGQGSAVAAGSELVKLDAPVDTRIDPAGRGAGAGAGRRAARGRGGRGPRRPPSTRRRPAAHRVRTEIR